MILMKINKDHTIFQVPIKCVLITVITVLFSLTIDAQEVVQLEALQKTYEVEHLYYSGERSLQAKDLHTIDIKQFNKKEIKPKIMVSYWSTFRIHKAPDIRPKFIEFEFSTVDRMSIHVPILNKDYKEYIIGTSNPSKKIKHIDEVSSILIDASTIDFTKPFFLENIYMSIFSKNSFRENFDLRAYEKKPHVFEATYIERELAKYNIDFESNILLGILIISCIFVLTFYLIHKRIYFLYYALYLFSLILIYTSWTPFVYNLYSGYNDYLYLYLSLDGPIIAMLFYMLFIREFVEMKKYYPAWERLYKVFIKVYIISMIIYNVIIIKNPYYFISNYIYNAIVYIASLFNAIVIVYMFIKRRSIHTIIVFVGSILLLIGLVLTTVLANKWIIVYVIFLETILFMSVISYLDLKYFKKSLEIDKVKEFSEFKSKLFSNLSHELRTPLTLITSPIQERLETEKLTDKDRMDFKSIQYGSKRLLRLVDRLLEVSGTESETLKLQVKKGNALNFIKNLTNSFFPVMNQKKLNYKVNIHNDADVWYDKSILESVITNLLSNAFKYTPVNGSVDCHGYIKEGMLYFEIRNTGKGLSEKQMEKVFDRYYRVDEKDIISGIGLDFTKEMVTLHKGIITVESTMGSWTSFKVRLPVDKKAFENWEIKDDADTLHFNSPEIFSDDAQDDVELEGNAVNKLPILLIVEDDPDLRSWLKNTFGYLYEVITAVNGQEGIDVALKYIPDLIISDVMMPEKDGIMLTKDLKNDERTSHIPIILLTAMVGEEHELIGIETGADDYIIKPPNTRILKAKAARLIASRKKLKEKYSQESVFNPKTLAITSIDEKFLTRLEKILHQYIGDSSFNIEKLGEIIGMGRVQLGRKIKTYTGLTPSEFLRTERLKKAAEILKKININISEIAYEVGFSSPANFGKWFREMYNCTPSEYRTRFHN